MSITIVVLDTRFKVGEARRHALLMSGQMGWRGVVSPEKVAEILQVSKDLREEGLKLSPSEEATLELATSVVFLQNFVSPLVMDLHGYGTFAILPVSDAVSLDVKEAHERFVDNFAWKLMEMDVMFYAFRVGSAPHLREPGRIW